MNFKSPDAETNYASAHQWYAVELSVEGRFDEALLQINQALELEPLSERISQLKGFILKLSRNYVHAINWQDSLVRLFPDNIYFNRQKAECYFRLGKKDSQFITPQPSGASTLRRFVLDQCNQWRRREIENHLQIFRRGIYCNVKADRSISSI
jgi:tetratricopeptide (TPR) repeat protein